MLLGEFINREKYYESIPWFSEKSEYKQRSAIFYFYF